MSVSGQVSALRRVGPESQVGALSPVAWLMPTPAVLMPLMPTALMPQALAAQVLVLGQCGRTA